MTRITVDVNDEWLEAAQRELETPSKVATINAALEAIAQRVKARDIIAALDSVEMDFTGAADAFRYGGGRDFDKLVEEARDDRVA